MDEQRAIVLLKATKAFLDKLRESGLSDALCICVEYDDADCDGYCLRDDIDALLSDI